MKPPVGATRRELERVQAELEACDSNLACAIMEEQDLAEWQVEHEGGCYDDFTEDEDGNPVGIIYPENAAYDLDAARTMVQEALDFLRRHLENMND